MQDITEKNKNLRYEMSKTYRTWTTEQWERVDFSDESFITPTKMGLQFFWKKPDEDWSDEKFRKKEKKKPVGIHLWRLITSEGFKKLVWTEGITWMNGEYYREEIIKPYILTNEEYKLKKNPRIFQ
jgi:hypothetical protein